MKRWGWLLSLLLVGTVFAQEQFEPEIAAFEAQPAQPGSIVFIGSSSIRMWTTLAQDFPDATVLNRGFGGSELRHVTHFAQRVLAPHAPSQVILYSGDNDLAEGRTPRQVEDDFVAFVAEVRRIAPGARIAVIAIKPSPARSALLPAQRDANARLARVAKASERVDFIDVFTPMLGADGQPRAELFIDDRLHLSTAGYALWRAEIAPFLRETR